MPRATTAAWRGHAAANGQNALRGDHAFDVLRRGLQANQNDLVALLGPLLGVLSGEYDLAARSARGRGEALADGLGGLQRLRVEHRMQQGIQLLRLYAHNGFLLGDLALVDQVDGNLQSGCGGALAVAGLQHVELAVFNGELHILHVAIVLLEAMRDVVELRVNLGHIVGELGDVAGGADAGNDVLALRVDQVFAEQLLLAGGGVAGERNAGAGLLIEVAEYHRLNVDGSAPGIGDVVHAAIDVRARVVPGAEHGLDRLEQLLFGAYREINALFFAVEFLEASSPAASYRSCPDRYPA